LFTDGGMIELDRPPILMGHSFGGTLTPLLLDRSLASADCHRLSTHSARPR
jgi:hypothetical protein